MKARKYYTLLGQFDAASPFEIIFGDYDREVVEQEKEDNENLDSDFGPKKLTIVTTGDKQEDIEDRVTALNNGWSEVNRKRAERTEKKIVTDEQKKIDQLAHVAQAYLVIWFSDLSVQVFSRNYQLISCDPEVASLVIQHKDEFKGDREDCYRSPDNGEIGEGRWYHSDPDILDYRLSPLTSTTER